MRWTTGVIAFAIIGAIGSTGELSAQGVKIDSPEVRALYCQYLGRQKQVIREVTREIGANPNDGLQPGNVVVLAGTAVMAPSLGPRGRTVEQSMRAIASLARIQPGNTVEIVERVYDDHDRLHYLALWREKAVSGFINPTSLSWINHDTKRLFAHVRTHEAKVDARMEAVAQEVFGPRGLDPAEVILSSASGAWARNC